MQFLQLRDKIMSFSSSTLEHKTDNFADIFKKADSFLEEKYKIATLTINEIYTSEQINLLTKKIEEAESNWQSQINLSEFKAVRQKDSNEELSDYEWETRFDEFKKAGMRYNLKIEISLENPHIADFILKRIVSKHVWALSLNHLFSKQEMDKILYACRDNSVGVIFFNNAEQEITDVQGQVLLKYVIQSQLHINSLQGKNFSRETALGLPLSFIETSS